FRVKERTYLSSSAPIGMLAGLLLWKLPTRFLLIDYAQLGLIFSLHLTRLLVDNVDHSRLSSLRAQEVLTNQLVNEVFDDIHDVYDFTGPVLGQGAFATVMCIQDKRSGAEYAVKQMDLSLIKDDASSMHMLNNEIKTMKLLSHPNIVRLQEVYQPKDRSMLYLVLDRLSGGSVKEMLKEQGRFEDEHAAHIMTQIAHAIVHCHSLGIVVSIQ
ncbi:unnamed protein product, partial [Choristocarpus tenellus]